MTINRARHHLKHSIFDDFQPNGPVEWPVHENYRIEHAVLLPAGEIVHRYDPLSEQQIAAELGKLSAGDEQGIIRFAMNWGLLGWRGSRVPSEEGDPIPWVWSHADNVRFVLQLFDYLQNRDGDGLRQFLDAHNLADLRDQEDTFIFKIGAELESLPMDMDPATRAELIITTTINTYLEGVNHRVDIAPSTTHGVSEVGFRLRPYCPNLLTAVYWHLANIVTENRRLRRCRDHTCGALFAVTDRRQQYCPPPPHWTGKRGSPCAARDHKRRQRQQKGD